MRGENGGKLFLKTVPDSAPECLCLIYLEIQSIGLELSVGIKCLTMFWWPGGVCGAAPEDHHGENQAQCPQRPGVGADIAGRKRGGSTDTVALFPGGSVTTLLKC